MDDEPHFDVFAGGVPPGEVFRSHVESLLTLSQQALDGGVSRTLHEVSLIGLPPTLRRSAKISSLL